METTPNNLAPGASVDSANTAGYAKAVATPPDAAMSGVRGPGDAPAGGDPRIGPDTKFVPGPDGTLQPANAALSSGVAVDNTTRVFDPENLQQHQIVRVYDHNNDGYPEFADVRNADGSTSVHVELPEEFKARPNAVAASVPILAPAICAATGLVVERHELINGVVPEANSPGKRYGENFEGDGAQHLGQTMNARDMASAQKIHDRFKSLEDKAFGPDVNQAAVEAQGAALRENQGHEQTQVPPATAEAPAPTDLESKVLD